MRYRTLPVSSLFVTAASTECAVAVLAMHSPGKLSPLMKMRWFTCRILNVLYIYIYIYIYICIYISYTYIICVYIYIYTHTYVSLSLSLYIYIYIYIIYTYSSLIWIWDLRPSNWCCANQKCGKLSPLRKMRWLPCRTLAIQVLEFLWFNAYFHVFGCGIRDPHVLWTEVISSRPWGRCGGSPAGFAIKSYPQRGDSLFNTTSNKTHVA